MKVKRGSSYSLAQRLLLLLLAPLLVGLAIVGWATVNRIKLEVNQLHDEFLSRSANVFTAFLQYEFAEEAEEYGDDDDDDEESAEGIAEEILEAVAQIEQQQGVSVNYRLTVSGRVVFTSADVATLPSCGEGFRSLAVQKSDSTQSTLWRCFGKSHTVPSSNQSFTAEFFELQTERSTAIMSVLRSAVLPLLALPFLVAIIAWLSIRSGMREVLSVSDAVGRRSIGNLDPLSLEHRPKELVPVLDSVNQLMRKVRAGIEREKQFTDDAAHELRTPITSISMIEQLIRRDNTQDNLTPMLDQLKRGVSQSQDIIAQLLRFARLQSQDELALTKQNMNELIQDQLNIHSSDILNKQLILDVCHPSLVMVAIDPAVMKLAIGNLISNAVKFSPNGGTILIEINACRFTIEDSGVGIAPEQRERIFDRFYRAPEVRSTPGTGLGLSLVKWVIDMHGFTVVCQEPNTLSGAAFAIYWAPKQSAFTF